MAAIAAQGGSRRRGARRPLPSLAELKERPSLTIPEAMRVSGYSRGKVNEKIESGDFESYPEGKRIRVVTQSILDHVTRKADEHRLAVAS